MTGNVSEASDTKSRPAWYWQCPRVPISTIPAMIGLARRAFASKAKRASRTDAAHAGGSSGWFELEPGSDIRRRSHMQWARGTNQSPQRANAPATAGSHYLTDDCTDCECH